MQHYEYHYTPQLLQRFVGTHGAPLSSDVFVRLPAAWKWQRDVSIEVCCTDQLCPMQFMMALGLFVEFLALWPLYSLLVYGIWNF